MKVTVYSTKTCGYCHMLKTWLKSKDVDYEEYKVDENPIAAQKMIQMSGQMGVPFTTVEKDDGNTVGVLGFDRPTLESVLGK
jgi:glutaredoxin